jgi:small neutral amino acid transporter SnatA (MarC family)
MELNAVDFIKTLGVTFAALFPIVNPLGCAPIFFGLTRNYPQSAQKVLAHKDRGLWICPADCFVALRQ